MSYTYPNGQPQGIAHQFNNKLREILISEIIAINGYQSHIANSSIIEINNVWHSIMLDEKKHYGWILQLLRKYDPEQWQQYLLHKTDDLGPQTPIQSYNPKPDYQIILNNLRDDVKGEFEAVILYEADILKFPYKDIQDVLRVVTLEEKGHAEHLIKLLLKYDPDAYDGLA